MILEDIFNTIQNNHKISSEDLDSYLENLIIQNEKLFSSTLIHDYIVDNLDNDSVLKNINKSISNNILAYLRSVIANWRKMKNKLTLEFINSFSKNFISKLKDIEIPFKALNNNKLFESKLEINKKKYNLWGVSEILNDGIRLYCNKIISSQLVSHVIVNSLEINEEVDDLIYFSKLMNDFNYYYNSNLDWYLNLIKDTFYDKLPEYNYNYVKRLTNESLFSNIYDFSNISLYYSKCYKLSKILRISEKQSCIKVFKKLANNLDDIIQLMINNKKNKLLISFIKNNNNIISDIFVYDNNILVKILSYIDGYNYNFNVNELKSLLSFYSNINDIINNNSILKSKSYQYVLIDKLSLFLNKESINIKLNIYIHYLVNKYNKINRLDISDKKKLIDQIESDFNFLFMLVSKMNNIDIFISEYKKNLILRLSNNFNIEIENKVFNIVNKYLNIKYLNSLKKIIYDYKISKKIVNDFSEYNESLYNEKYDVIMTSYGNWDISTLEGNYKNKYFEITDLGDTLDNDFKQFIISFDYFYKQKYQDKRYLVWYPHLGKLNIDIELNKKINIDLLPIQYQILMFIINRNFLDINQLFEKLKKIVSYKFNFIQNLVMSLVKSNIVYVDYVKVNNVEVESKTLYINNNYNDKEYINLIDIFYSLSNINFKWEISRKSELVHDRITILMTIINTILKYDKFKNGVQENELLEESNKRLSLFEVDKLLLENALSKMVKKNFIRICNNNKYLKVIY